VASGSLLSRTQRAGFAGAGFACILDRIDPASPIMSAAKWMATPASAGRSITTRRDLALRLVSPESLGAMFGKLVLLPLLILLIAVLPFWRHSARWGYIPAGFVAIALLVVYIFARLGRL
jgi:hypothetical protein